LILFVIISPLDLKSHGSLDAQKQYITKKTLAWYGFSDNNVLVWSIRDRLVMGRTARVQAVFPELHPDDVICGFIPPIAKPIEEFTCDADRGLRRGGI
jgi:hypothetical protein